MSQIKKKRNSPCQSDMLFQLNNQVGKTPFEKSGKVFDLGKVLLSLSATATCSKITSAMW